MKPYLIPALVIGLFLALVAAGLSHLGSSGPQTSSGRKPVNPLAPMYDRTSLDLKGMKATSGPKVQAWGTIRAAAVPAVEATSFHNQKLATQDTTAQAKKKEQEKKKKKKKAEKKKKSVKKTAKAKVPTADSGGFESSESTQIYGGFPILSQKKKVENPVTIEDWFLVISDPENREKLYEFIKLHQAGLVTDAVFIGVSEKLVQDKSKGLRRFGLLAIGSYISVASLEIISDFIGQESDSNLKAMAQGNLDVYQSLSSLMVLRSALGSASDSARYYAALLVGSSAQLNLKQSQTPPTAPSPGRGGRDRQFTLAIQSYQTFLPAIENMIAGDSSTEVRQAAMHSRDILLRLPQPFLASAPNGF